MQREADIAATDAAHMDATAAFTLATGISLALHLWRVRIGSSKVLAT
ncbi:hypothetical protein MKK70_07500 [Methylobacterium sp. E-041]|nr:MULTISPECIES: hypothetical protein [unclassified Methylobacterium]MCJ2041965.1 hypothetical protein [Methylobacterium sp. J-059]MCJ2105227.1 hypothetical protein [Methylobacterium sp. E-041]